MAPGVNLWNTLDAVCGAPADLGSETCWGNPRTTKAMITDMKNRGFKTLRIPVTWYNHMGSAPNYTIDRAWMDRVEEVANYAFDNDMYVIINIHHDDYDEGKYRSWLSPTYNRQNASIDQLRKVWTQIANRFKNYGDYLIFETMNEPRAVGTPQEWTGGNAEHRDVVNKLNLAAVNAIRATGGNNASRFIMTPQVGATGHAAIYDLEIPNNDNKVIVSIHNYGPFSFTLQQPGTNRWGTQQEIRNLQNDIKSYYDNFTSKGRAVVIGEWGAADKSNLADRVKYYEVFAEASKQYKVAPISWIYSYDRNSRTWKYPALEDAIFKTYGATNAVTVPGKIEAENYTSQSGIQNEGTSDVGGGQNIGYIENGDYSEYEIDVDTAGDYYVTFRVASNTSGGKIDVYSNGSKLGSVNVSNTGGWQNWRDVSKTLTLSQGKQKLRLVYVGSGGQGNYLLNVNYIDIR